MKVGDIFTYAYSYNARYPQFVRVTRMTDKTAWFEQLEKTWHDSDGYGQNGTVVPKLDGNTRPMDKGYRIKNSKCLGEYVKIDGKYATLWDGTPEDQYTD